ncbi:hypothetical protein P3T76_016384 [Phytophthora citrophthora]|uniref:Crinkler effector protein N-terminal domain-containing protein n=1 Tax=Phytophthora citrophthora TaxID=4793 RepID=A0AAD9FXL9_9STRA|nr:hypothetical protein P3T76_016384 [Phytophthora citrophthora]
MKSLSCMAVEDGGIVIVVIDDFNNVGLLKDIVKEKKMYNFAKKDPVEQLELYVAKKDGNWLKLNDPDV